QDAVEIRGCSFEFLARRELYYTYHIEQLVRRELGWTVANRGVGYWIYDLKSIPESICRDEKYLSVKRCCSIFQTIGDRRLNDHLLLGIEMLLPYLIDLNDELLGRIPKCFPDCRRDDESQQLIST